MSAAALLHPALALYQGAGKPFPALSACEHYAGNEKLIRKALQLQAELGPVFDITGDCEDGAPAGGERQHAEMVAALVNSADNRFDRLGARIHDASHPTWRQELEIIVAAAGERLAYVVLPKANSAAEAAGQIAYLDELRDRCRLRREIPVHVLIETPGALHEAWEIARLPHVESLDFGLMDFVSAHHGAIPAMAMRSPGQFEHPLISRAKCVIAAAALGNGIVPSHNVCTEIRDVSVAGGDARRARENFGYLRMWSIHPNQILPIVEAMRPRFDEVTEASALLCAAQDAGWGPVQREGRLHDRASYRYYWELLQRARATGMTIPDDADRRFFPSA